MVARKLSIRSLLHAGVVLCLATGSSWGETDPDTSWPSGDGPLALDVVRDFHVPDSQLAELIAELLTENPATHAARELSYSHLERMRQERALPDPQFSYRLFLSEPETRVGPQKQGVEISQGLPWVGKRGLAAERAGHLATAASWDARDLERTLVAELKKAYFEAAYLQEALAINEEERSLLERFEQSALTRYSTGEGIQQSVIKVQTDITRLADQRIALHERLRGVEWKIAQLLGRPETPLTLLPIRLEIPRPEYDLATLQREALERNPDAHAARKRIEADTAWSRRRHRESYPDFSVGLGYVDVGKREDTLGMTVPPEDNGKDIWAFTVKLNVPLYRGRIRAGIAEAESSLRASREDLRRTEDAIVHAVRDSVLRLGSLDERTGLYRDLLIPQAEEALASAEAAYTTNRQSFLDLLDAERVLFQVRLTYHRLLSDYWISLADLERVIARPFPDSSAVEDAP